MYIEREAVQDTLAVKIDNNILQGYNQRLIHLHVLLSWAAPHSPSGAPQLILRSGTIAFLSNKHKIHYTALG